MGKTLTEAQVRVLIKLARPQHWANWGAMPGWRGRMASGYVHYFKPGRTWPEYDTVLGPTFKKLMDGGFIERGEPYDIKVDDVFVRTCWRISDVGREYIKDATD